MKKTLVILAAGIGSRYGGGVKQLEPVGPDGEIIIDYSIHDALEAGFNRVVFIIRRDLDADFRERIGNRIEKVTEVAYAYQEIEDLPAGYRVPQGRMKPWGTGQALLAAKDQIHEPFAVVNADDYYGKHGFRILHDALVSGEPVENGKHNVSMAAFVLGNTLSDNGGVTRGILEVENGQLTGINETKNIVRTDGGAGVMTGDGVRPLDADSLVSMNMWGLYPDFLDELEHGFPKFLDGLGEDALKKEYLLPDIIDRMLKAGKAAVHVFRTDDVWFGVTYREDRDAVRAAFADLIEKGVYRTPLF